MILFNLLPNADPSISVLEDNDIILPLYVYETSSSQQAMSSVSPYNLCIVSVL